MAEHRCGNCDAEVSNRYHRVMSDPDTGEVRACPECEDSVQRMYGTMS